MDYLDHVTFFRVIDCTPHQLCMQVPSPQRCRVFRNILTSSLKLKYLSLCSADFSKNLRFTNTTIFILNYWLKYSGMRGITAFSFNRIIKCLFILMSLGNGYFYFRIVKSIICRIVPKNTLILQNTFECNILIISVHNAFKNMLLKR